MSGTITNRFSKSPSSTMRGAGWPAATAARSCRTSQGTPWDSRKGTLPICMRTLPLLYTRIVPICDEAAHSVTRKSIDLKFMTGDNCSCHKKKGDTLWRNMSRGVLLSLCCK